MACHRKPTRPTFRCPEPQSVTVNVDHPCPDLVCPDLVCPKLSCPKIEVPAPVTQYVQLPCPSGDRSLVVGFVLGLGVALVLAAFWMGAFRRRRRPKGE